MQIETVPIDSLQEHPRNYRAHPDEQVVEIAHSLNQFGQYKPVVISSDGVILAGHGVVRGVKASGSETVEVHRMEFTADDPRAEKLIVADNELSRMAQDDDAALAALLQDVAEKDSLAGTGFDDAGLAALLKEVSEQQKPPPVEDPGAGEPPPDPVTKLGDVWLMGEHRLVCGDSTEPAFYADGLQAQCVVTSPPYAQQRIYELDGFDWDSVVPLVIATAAQHVTPDGSILVNLGLVHEDGRVVEYWRPLFDMMETQGRPLFGWYVWDKLDGLPGDWSGRLRPSHEWVFHFAKIPRRPAKTKECKHAGHVITYAGMRKENGSLSGWTGLGDAVGTHKEPDSVIRCSPAKGGIAGHPAPFPPEFAMELIEPYASQGESVLDPFIGSGTTLIACEQLGRVCYGIEIEPRYVDVAVKRWMKATGRVATLEATGAPFPAGE